MQTGERIRELRVREGQQRFSDNVRGNYSGRCCFPHCPIVEQHFLIGAHIARWSDVPHLRGKVSNGLCFCLMHDKALTYNVADGTLAKKPVALTKFQPQQRYSVEDLEKALMKESASISQSVGSLALRITKWTNRTTPRKTAREPAQPKTAFRSPRSTH